MLGGQLYRGEVELGGSGDRGAVVRGGGGSRSRSSFSSFI